MPMKGFCFLFPCVCPFLSIMERFGNFGISYGQARAANQRYQMLSLENLLSMRHPLSASGPLPFLPPYRIQWALFSTKLGPVHRYRHYGSPAVFAMSACALALMWKAHICASKYPVKTCKKHYPISRSANGLMLLIKYGRNRFLWTLISSSGEITGTQSILGHGLPHGSVAEQNKHSSINGQRRIS